ncbi:MAG: LysR family transcriptional regulator [Proteobacteria bacterium]|nr:LysR family transcriptional regulator [Pseudomonadota bacterium]
MQDSFKTGITTTNRITVDRPRTIDVMGEELRVYATPELVRDIERTCKGLILDYADVNEDSVGTNVNIDHIAPTLMGMSVDIIATVKEIDRRKVVFEISAVDDIEPMGRGTHTRFIIDTSKSAERLQAKIAKVKAL